MNNILSGEEMLLAQSKSSYELPPVGVKEFEPNHSWLEQKQIQSALDQRKALLEAERVEKESNLMTADWKTEKHKASVSRKGRHWETFGHHLDDGDWLFAEEVLFLMEMNCLECLYGEIPLSIQKAYSVLLKPENGCSLDEYRVFAHLCRAGYRVLRHLPNLTVTAYERTIRLDQHLLERKTYHKLISIENTAHKGEAIDVNRAPGNQEDDIETTQVPDRPKEVAKETTLVPDRLKEVAKETTQVPDRLKEVAKETTQVPDRLKEVRTEKTQINEMPAVADVNESEGIITEKTQLSDGPEEVATKNTQLPNQPEEMVTCKVPVITRETPILKKALLHRTGELTKRKLRKMQRKNRKLREKLLTLIGGCVLKKSQSLQTQQKGKLCNSLKKFKPQHTQKCTSEDQLEVERKAEVEHKKRKSLRLEPDDDTPRIPPDKWQPPVVITDLPENIEMTIGSTSVLAGKSIIEKEVIEIIDIADTSSEEEVETDEVDSDIEIIQEIRPSVHNNKKEEDEEEEEEDEDDLEIIEVPISKKEVIVETLSSDSEEEEEEESGSGSGSERSYDGNWKRNSLKKKSKFVRPPTMSHLTFAAVEEFCAEKKPQRESLNNEDNSNNESDGNSEFISLETSNLSIKRPVFQVEKTRNEILDLMPTMAGQNRKLITLDQPDVRLIPDGIIPKQQAYTYSTNALRARVFRQGFRGRRNFHGPRFTSFNPYYNSANGNFFPNQLNFGGPQALFQAPQLSQMLGGGDITTVARGVMHFASALLMNLPQNSMNNGLIPYHPRSHFPSMNPNFAQIESAHLPSPRFPPMNQNYQYTEPSNITHHGLNMPQRNNSNLEYLFDLPQQRNVGNNNRFSENSNSPEGDNNQYTPNFSVDLSQWSSESDFDSRDNNFTPPSRSNHRGGKKFRNNRAANFRNKRGRFRGKHQTYRGGFSQRNSPGGTLNHSHGIDPAYVKPDVPIPGERNSIPQSISDYIPILSAKPNQNPVEIISIDDNDDNFVPKRGISNRFTKKRRRKNKLLRLDEVAKRKIRKINSAGETNPEIVFLDSPTVSKTSADESTLDSVKQENEKEIQVKTETESEHRSIKQEEMETSVGANIKKESVQELGLKVENQMETNIKTEKASEESSGIRVKVEQGESGQNVRVEIKIESSSDTSSVMSLPLANLVKEEPHQVKLESNEEVKSEPVDVVEKVKTEILDCHVSKEGILETEKTSRETLRIEDKTVEKTQVEPMDTSAGESEKTQEDGINESVSEVEVVNRNTVVENRSNNEVLCNRTEPTLEDTKNNKVFSWADLKKNHLPLPTFQDTVNQDETDNEIEDEEEIRPLLRPKHCTTIGSVLSALQIFTPLTSPPIEDVLRLKISFDLYPPTEFRKSHRGLPQYRIVVFSGADPLPSPAQLREVNSRFQDGVPILTAIVTPGSVTFYTFSDIDLPQDSNSYTK